MSHGKIAKGILLAVVMAAAASLVGQTNTTESGKTTVTLGSGFVSSLYNLKLVPGTIGPTTISGATATFPAVAGAFDVNNAKGQILHSGGLTVANSKTRVRLQSFIIDTTGSAPVLTGLVVVNGVFVGRMTLFDLQLPSAIKFPLTAPSGVLTLSGVGVTLDASGAAALNKVFAVTAFNGGLKVGTAKVTVMVNPDTGN